MASRVSAGPAGEWRELGAAALLGSERLGGAFPAVGGAPGALLAKLKTADPPVQLLRAAAVLGLYAIAGRRGGSEAPVGADAPPERDTDVCSPRAGQLLGQVLYGEHGFLLAEWCGLAVRRGVRAPDELLPGLLNACAAKDAPIELGTAARMLGARGRWLAGFNAEWRGLIAPDDPGSAWRTGEPAQRMAALRGLRRSDPGAARALILETWAQEEPDDRAAIIACLRIGLTQEDEPFLEDALDDKRKGVRTEAADLLARLPESRFRVRMEERARGLVSWSMRKRLLRSAQLELSVELPQAIDKTMTRDGIESRKQHGLGEKAYALCQVLAGASLGLWTAQSGAQSAEMVACACESEFKEALLRGWAVAAVRQGEAGWAGALLAAEAKVPEAFDDELRAALAACLPESEREAVVRRRLEQKGPLDGAALRGALLGLTHAWSEEFSGIVLEELRGHFARPDAQYDHALRKSVAQEFSRYLAPALAGEAAERWPRQSGTWHRGDEEMVSSLAATLAFRQSMLEEFSRDEK